MSLGREQALYLVLPLRQVKETETLDLLMATFILVIGSCIEEFDYGQ